MNKDLLEDYSRVEFDGSKGRVVFHGDCDDMRPVCRAMCCRHAWWIGLSQEEYASGRLQSDVICSLSDKACHDLVPACSHRRVQLAKRPDKSCVYLENDRCGIYDQRPVVCREFQCQGGWQLGSISPAPDSPAGGQPAALARETFLQRLTDDITFVPHPLLRVHTVFYLQSRKEVVFIKEMIGACGKFSTRDDLDQPRLDDAQILGLIGLFNRKEPLSQVYRRFCSQEAGKLTRPEFHAIVWLLNKHNVILDSRNFKGMLSGVGAIG